jgi:putative transposase
MRKNYSAEFKARLVLDILMGKRSANDIARDNGVSKNSINRWKVQAIINFSQVFQKDFEVKHMEKNYKAKIDDLYKQIGEIVTKNRIIQ